MEIVVFKINRQWWHWDVTLEDTGVLYQWKVKKWIDGVKASCDTYSQLRGVSESLCNTVSESVLILRNNYHDLNAYEML